MYAEISDVIGVSHPPRLSDHTELPYTSAVISEVQRIADIVPIVPHAATEDTSLNGYSIPKGTQIMINWNSVNHDPEIWPEPAVFKPERFLDENGKYKSRTEFAPFAQGTY